MDVRDGQRFTTEELDMGFGLAFRTVLTAIEEEGHPEERLAQLRGASDEEIAEMAQSGIAGARALPDHLKPIHAEGARLALLAIARTAYVEPDGSVKLPAEAVEIAPSIRRILDDWGPKGA